ncbi:hypothetical protein [Halomonas denitrificans]|nr:hypothetical protein [Halomonas denitrificans]
MTSTIPSTPKWTRVPAAGKQINTCAITPDGHRVVCGTWVERGPGVSGDFHVYCYDASGDLLYSIPVSDEAIEHGVYWVAISDDGSTLAAGGEVSDTEGFLRVYGIHPDAPPNTMRLVPLLATSTPSRVNEVSLGADGSRLVACYGSTVALYGADGSFEFRLLDTFDAGAEADVQSVMIDEAGRRAVAASRTYGANNATTGKLVRLEIGSEGFTSHRVTPFDSGVMRVAITADGSAWGGSLHDGSCVCFQDNVSEEPAWRFKPTGDQLPKGQAISLAYGFAISGSSAGTVHVAVGANLDRPATPAADPSYGGVVYSLASKQSDGTVASDFLWSRPTAFGVNPGVGLDEAGLHVTATDGKPADHGHGVHESAGHFYLYDNATGDLAWSVKTRTMNWPMAISADGHAIVGGSDDGSLYYWTADAEQDAATPAP